MGNSRARISRPVVVLTQPRRRSLRMAEPLARAGARLVFAPMIRIAPPRSYAALDRAIKNLGRYDALVFASQNSVEFFLRRWRKMGRPALPDALFAVGPGTARAMRSHALGRAVIPKTFRAEQLARLILRAGARRVLLPRAREGREELPRVLRSHRVSVAAVEAYQTLPDPTGLPKLKAAAKNEITVVAFTSGSAVKSLFSQLGSARCRRMFRHAKAASIGPVTSAELRLRGVRRIIEAPEATLESLARRIASALS
ncbi:MAG: uroporphyrinogen-III synthase [Elusimicrobia bacterium]|nr:uroporphyrinogen-III synthase [Elusimicrobiota bacterium]